MVARAERMPNRGAGALRRVLHNALAGVGYHVERLRDPYVDAVRQAGRRRIDLAVDGGAYKGAATHKLLTVCPDAQVLAFEPMPDFAAALRKRFADEPRVQIVEKALSDRCGTATFHVHETPYTSSLHDSEDSVSEMQVDRNVTVERVSLDEVLDATPARAVLVKLDLQGHEVIALQGMDRALRDGRIRAMVVEVNFARRYQAGCSFADLVAALGEAGFGLHRLYEVRLSASDGYEIGDALFVRDPDRALAASTRADATRQ